MSTVDDHEGDHRRPVPPLGETVPILHRQLQVQAQRVTDLARILPQSSPSVVRRDLRQLVVALDRHLLPYMEVEELALD